MLCRRRSLGRECKPSIQLIYCLLFYTDADLLGNVHHTTATVRLRAAAVAVCEHDHVVRIVGAAVRTMAIGEEAREWRKS